MINRPRGKDACFSFVEALEQRTLLAYTPPVSGRADLNLDPGWKFIKTDVVGAGAKSFNDSGWTNVNLPHTWNTQDAQDGGDNYYQGVGWYRKHFTIDSKFKGKQFFLKFEGAMLDTDVYVNGAFVGNHKGGYSAFVFDMNPYVKVGADNVLAVKCNNSNNPDIAPYIVSFAPDWPKWGGLYRDVHLMVTNTLQVNPLNMASPGLFIKQSNVSNASADLEITAEVRNSMKASRRAALKIVILDQARNIVGTLISKPALVKGKTVKRVIFTTKITNPHLWDGVNDPHLYRLYAEVSEAGAVTDVFAQNTGLRYFSVDPNKGFFLNGKPYNLHGVSYYTDRLDKGSAVSAADRAEDISMILEMGANTVRLAHYQHSPEEYDLLDRAGIVAWNEIPLDRNVTNTAAFTQNVTQQLTETIRQEYNHPSVIFIGLANELEAKPQSYELVTSLQGIAKIENPGLITTVASNIFADADVLKFGSDLQAFNRYYGWYTKDLKDLKPWIDNVHSKYPTKPIAVSEFGAGGSINQHEANPPRPSDTATPYHPEEYLNLTHETYWSVLKTRPWVYGSWAWEMFDSASDKRNQGDTSGRVDKGLVTFDRKTKKDAFYFYKANWSQAPVVYISSRRWVDRPTNVNDVKVYANLDSVTLTLNGVTVGTVTPSSIKIAKWSGLTFQPGENTIVVSGKKNGVTYTDSVKWNAPTSTPPPQPQSQPQVQPLASLFSNKYVTQTDLPDAGAAA